MRASPAADGPSTQWAVDRAYQCRMNVVGSVGPVIPLNILVLLLGHATGSTSPVGPDRWPGPTALSVRIPVLPSRRLGGWR